MKLVQVVIKNKLIKESEKYMGTLFVIGNGFDLDHNLKTSYKDFKEYLKNQCGDFDESRFGYISFKEMPKGDIVVDETDILANLIHGIDQVSNEFWSNLEEELANVIFDDFFEQKYPLDEDGDEDFWKKSYINNDNSIFFKELAKTLLNKLKEWILSIKYENVIPKDEIINLIKNKECIFLNFNYTETLEKFYGQTCYHIHGKIGDDKLQFGHNDENDYTDELVASYLGAEDNIQTVKNIWFKNTALILKNNSSFFEELKKKNINEIYFYGFSFGKVDLVYIQEIIKNIDSENCTCYLRNFDSEEVKKQKIKLREQYFLREITIF